ncbi:putative beta-glucosidase [Aspergillus japonicus CBS 114.51]|uniref:Probable beta-glucosidase M n=1 Tax=Aspergillus japonicus CBS 114.51 TaxID=1448312 RepID=A0A8T8XD72_ASPJA|nr:putative beta-glucosidase [Aspergillus japonicus CBS 114.51]RAH86226.1 putative beta-glucosidase [Aspergillus japonicus CBS 114.51]
MKLTVPLTAAALPLAGAAVIQPRTLNVTDLEHYWSYGRSEPVYPTPETQGLGDWEDAFTKAKALVAQMTDEEKNNITYGYSSTTNGCSGNTAGVPRLGYPGICLQDAASGVRGTDMVNGYASGLHVGASWNRELAYQRAQYMGAEFKRKGVNVALGPVAGPLGRIARGGRNWEGFSNDPYLAGALTGDTVRGLQESVIACVKHLIGNEQETNRNSPQMLTGSHNNSVSSNIDDKTMHELYLWPFQDAVKAGAGSVMCSYNRINNSYGCQNSKTMNGLLKGELGFQGFVVSDWSAQHTGLASADAGLDMAMPSSEYWDSNQLATAVANGSLAATRLDDMATRIVAAWYKYAELEDPGHGMPVSLLEPHTLVDARDPAAKETIFQGAVEGHVLVKNTNQALPLSSPRFLSLFGYDAVAAPQNTMDDLSWSLWAMGWTNTQTYPNGSAVDPTMLKYIFLSSADPTATGPGIALNGTMYTGGGSGASTPSYIDAPFDALQRQARADNTFLAWDFTSPAPLVNPASEACLVFINAAAAEGWDRPALSDSYSDNLVQHVASQCNNTMVIIHNAGIRPVDAWIEHPNITAVMYAHLPGQDSGAALVEVLYGKQSPSGRLPYTVARNASDYGALLGPTLPSAAKDKTEIYYPQDDFSEGVYIDYKHFEARNITPRFEFGFGLTYANFTYSNLVVTTPTTAVTSYTPPDITAATVAEGGLPSLWDVLVAVSCTLENTGAVAAKEVAQLYVGIPGGPAKVLRGFAKELVEPGQTKEVTFHLTRRDLSTWDVVAQSWVLPRGEYGLFVGKSVADVQLTGSVSF